MARTPREATLLTSDAAQLGWLGVRRCRTRATWSALTSGRKRLAVTRRCDLRGPFASRRFQRGCEPSASIRRRPWTGREMRELSAPPERTWFDLPLQARRLPRLGSDTLHRASVRRVGRTNEAAFLTRAGISAEGRSWTSGAIVRSLDAPDTGIYAAWAEPEHISELLAAPSASGARRRRSGFSETSGSRIRRHFPCHTRGSRS